MATIKIKRIYDTPEKSDGFRILVDRLWPRGMKKEKASLDLWGKEIAPSNELRRWFNHDPKKWVEFQKRYVKELEITSESLDALIKKAKNKTITLLFAAKEIEHNNAVALRNIILRKIKH